MAGDDVADQVDEDDEGAPRPRELDIHEYLERQPRRSLRQLPRLLGRSIALVWAAGRRDLLVVAAPRWWAASPSAPSC